MTNPGNAPDDALTERELGELAEYIEPNHQERVAQILHPEEGSMMVAFLRAEHRDNVWGIGNDILQRWLKKNPPPGNRLVSMGMMKLAYRDNLNYSMVVVPLQRTDKKENENLFSSQLVHI